MSQQELPEPIPVVMPEPEVVPVVVQKSVPAPVAIQRPVSSATMKETTYPLPSAGLAYKNLPMQLIDGDCIKIRPMLVGDQRRAGSAGTDPYFIYQKLLSRCVVHPNMDQFLDEILLSDATAALWAIRAITWGPEYKVEVTCTGCKVRKTQILDTSNLQIKRADEIDGYKSTDIEVEIGDKVITMHLPTMRDSRNLSANINRLTRSKMLDDPENDSNFILVAGYIDTIDGKPVQNIGEAFTFVDGLLQEEFDKILTVVNDMDAGIQPVQVVTCKKCNREIDVVLTVTPEFFRPTK